MATTAMTMAESEGPARPVRVVVVDDHEHIRGGLARLFGNVGDIELVGSAGAAESGVALCREQRPDVVIMDLRLPGVDGAEATRLITDALPDTRVVILTSFPHHARIGYAMQHGAVGYLLKDDPPESVVNGVRRAAAGLDPRPAR